MAGFVYTRVGKPATLSWLDADGLSHTQSIRMNNHVSTYSGHAFMAYGRLYLFVKPTVWNNSEPLRIIRLPDNLPGDVEMRENSVYSEFIRPYLMDDGTYMIVYLYRGCHYPTVSHRIVVMRLVEDDTTELVYDQSSHSYTIGNWQSTICTYDPNRAKMITQIQSSYPIATIVVPPGRNTGMIYLDVREDMLLFAEPYDSPVNLHVYDMSRGICTRIGDISEGAFVMLGAFLAANVVLICCRTRRHDDRKVVWNIINITDGSIYAVIIP